MNSIIWTGYQSTGTGWSSIWLNGDKAVGYNNHIEVSSGSNFEFSRSGNNIFSDENPFVTYELADNSQAIGQGKSSIQFDGETITPHGKDFFGNDRPRPAGTNPDMGAVENDLSEPKYNRYTVAQDGTGDFSELSFAINWNTNLVDNDTVIIKPGTYLQVRRSKF